MEGAGGFQCQENENVNECHFEVGVRSVQNGGQSVLVKDTCVAGEERVARGDVLFFGGVVGRKGVSQGLEGAPHTCGLGLERMGVELAVGWVWTKDAHVTTPGGKGRGL